MKRAKRNYAEAKHTRADHSAKIDTEIEAILAGEEKLLPTSGFLSSTMERVRLDAAMPVSIPFPWKQAIAYILLATGVAGWGAVELVRFGLPVLRLLTLSPPNVVASFWRPLEQAGWVALALGISLASWLFSYRLADTKGLL